VTDVDLDPEGKTVSVLVAASESASFSCPECDRSCPKHDTRDRRWRHLDTCQYQTILVVRVPRVDCPEHGVRQVRVPWGEPGSRFTALFEALVIDWLKEASIAAVARLIGLTWDEVDGIMQRAVTRGLARRKPRALRGICVDETSFQKRHEYVTVVTDLDGSDVLHVADDRRKGSLDEFYETLTPEQREALEVVAMDMANSYVASTRENVPEAETKICFDRFHVARLIGDALDKVRREEHRALLAEGDRSLTKTKHLLLRRGDSLTASDEGIVDILRRLGLKTARAWAIKEAATKLWHYVRRGSAGNAWRRWIAWAMRSRIEPIKAAARTIRAHLWGIVNAIKHGVTNATAESINAKIQKVKRMACGFRSRDRFRTAILFHLGGLQLYPVSLTHTGS
jgi:transposase